MAAAAEDVPLAVSVLRPEVERFSMNVSQRVASDPRTAPLQAIVVGYYPGMPDLDIQSMENRMYWGFVLRDEKVTLLAFVCRNPCSSLPYLQVRDQVVGMLKESTSQPPEGVVVTMTGDRVTDYDQSRDESMEVMFRAECCVFPPAMFVLMYIVGDMRLLVFAPVVLAVTFLTSLLLPYPLTFTRDIYRDNFAAMMSVCMALSLDYSLFILSRFSENREKSLRRLENVLVTMRHTAHTIFVSGTWVAVAFFGGMTNAGAVFGTTALSCVMVSSTLYPAALLGFGESLATPPTTGACFGFFPKPSVRTNGLDLQVSASLDRRRLRPLRALRGAHALSVYQCGCLRDAPGGLVERPCVARNRCQRYARGKVRAAHGCRQLEGARGPRVGSTASREASTRWFSTTWALSRG